MAQKTESHFGFSGDVGLSYDFLQMGVDVPGIPLVCWTEEPGLSSEVLLTVAEKEVDPHLSQMLTDWSMVFQAHGVDVDVATLARLRLLERYSGALRSYLMGALRDSDAVNDLVQEFALRFVRGGFHNADPERGRFRDFVKTALSNLIVDYRKKSKSQPQPLPETVAEEPVEIGAESDREFLQCWRGELLARAWEAMSRQEKETGLPVHTVLRHRVLHPESRSAQMAEELSTDLGKTVTATWVRQTLHRAREMFVEFLVDEVRHSLEQRSRENLEQELIDLGLWSYCKGVLDKGDTAP